MWAVLLICPSPLWAQGYVTPIPRRPPPEEPSETKNDPETPPPAIDKPSHPKGDPSGKPPKRKRKYRLDPKDGEPKEEASESDEDEPRASRPQSKTSLEFDARLLFTVSGRATVPDAAYEQLVHQPGAGLDLVIAAGPKGSPFLAGIQLGLDSFGGEKLSFRYRDDSGPHVLVRSALQTMGVLRYEPSGRFRPHIDLLAGLWMFQTSVEGSAVLGPSPNDVFGSASTFALGLGTGFHYAHTSGLLLGMSLSYHHGRAMSAPDVRSAEAIGGDLFYEETRVDSVNQWILSLSIGFDTEP